MSKYKKIAIVIIWTSILWIIFQRYSKLNSPKYYNELDSLDTLLYNVKNKIPPGSVVGFNTNTSFDEKTLLYFKSAMILAPIVLEVNSSDTMLLIKDNKLGNISTNEYEKITEGFGKKYNYMLINRKK